MTGWTGAVLPITMFGLNVLVQIVLARSVFRHSLLKAVMAGFFTGLFFLLVLETVLVFRSPLSRVDVLGYAGLQVITYGCLGYCYMHFVNLGETARRIRILRELDESPEGLPLDQLLKGYPAGEIIARRKERLLASNQIRCERGRYFIQDPMMVRTANIIGFLKKFLLGKSSEFD